MLVKFRLLQEQPPDAFCKKLFLERYSQNSEEKTCGRYSILIKLHSHGCKKETLAQVFSFKFSKIYKNTFFTEQLRTTASGFSFSEVDTGGVLWKISQNSQENTFGLWNFQIHLFLQNSSGRLFLAFSCNVTKMGYCQQCLENLRWIFII